MLNIETPLRLVGAGLTLLVALLSATWGAYVWLDTTYARSEEVEQVLRDLSVRLEQKIISDRIGQLQQRLWVIEERYGRDLKGAPETVKEEYRQLREQKRTAEHELDALVRQKGK